MSFTVRIEPSGHRFAVAENESILDAALRQGYAFPYGCRNGGCGSCKGKVVSGTVDYPQGIPAALTLDETRLGMALFCQARPGSDLVVEVREINRPQELSIKILPAKVQKKTFLADDVVQIFLKTPETERLQFLAGQYIDILLKDGRRRSFSLANAPHDDALLELHIRHVEGGDFTGFVSNELKEKNILRIEGPHGNFYLREDSDRPLIFIAGGTGFAPIKGIIEHALSEGLKQTMYLYWGVRDSKDLYMAELPRKWAKHLPNFHFVPVFSEPRFSEPEFSEPTFSETSEDARERIGYVHEAVVADFSDGVATYDVYASGPPIMVQACFDALQPIGLSEDNYFSDAFEFQSPKAETS